MQETTMSITSEERQFLIELLEHALKDAQVEEHRTRAPSFREHVLKKEDLIKSVLKKMGAS